MSLTCVPFLRGILERRSGLDLGRGGMEAGLANFVHQRLASNGLTFEQYLAQLEIPGSEELRLLLETMTVVYTWFFRDPGQFLVVEQLVHGFTLDRPMTIWVAGCATGEEAYSVALVVAALGKQAAILATDINSTALESAKRGYYRAASLNAIDAAMRDRYLGAVSGDFIVPDNIRQMVRFQSHNLIDAAPRAPAAEGWDLIICRNVLIYFTPEQARRALDAFSSGLRPDGHLLLGASEAILERPTMLNVVGVAGRAVLRRPRHEQRHGTETPSAKVPSASACGMHSAHMRKVAVLPPTQTKPHDALPDRTSGVQPTQSRTAGELPLSSVASALQAGCATLEAGDIARAKQLCMVAVELDPSCAEAAMFAGIAHYLDGDFSEALRLLRGALCLDWTLWAACFYQALCYENVGCVEDAARSYAQVLRITEQRDADVKGYALLENWRDDLLTVAKKRAHQLTNHRMRAQV